jgi:TonB family protein
MVYLRADKDEPVGAAVWQEITKSIAIDTGGRNDFNFAGESIDGGVLNGMAVKLVKPDYPPEAANARVGGRIEVEVTIDEHGGVIDAEANQGNQYLRFAAMGAARKSKFSPTTVCGKPVKVTGKITYDFAR